jgi:acyl-CoA synthetase (AMP-forming)/AMP-acid ligase II
MDGKKELFIEDYLTKWSDVQGSEEAFRFVDKDISEYKNISYSELRENALFLAQQLKSLGVNKSDRVLIVMTPGLAYIESFFSCLYLGAIAVPCYPPTNKRNIDQLTAIIKSSRPKIILMDTFVQQHLKKFKMAQLFAFRSWIRDLMFAYLPFDNDLSFALTPWLLHTNNRNKVENKTVEDSHSGEDIAFLQYTSGSTGSPKGVIVTRGQLMTNIKQIYHAFSMNNESRGVIWLPPYHDMGLIGGILAPIYGGFPVLLTSPTCFLKRPKIWLEAIHDFRGTISGGPNFAYELLLRKWPAERKDIDLSCWKVAFCGAEPIQSVTFSNFDRTFDAMGFSKKSFYPCYGLAEGTLFVSGKDYPSVYKELCVNSSEFTNGHIHIIEPDSSVSHKTLVSSGQIADGVSCRIVNLETKEICPDNQIGEIWLSGPSLTSGYWQDAAKTKELFDCVIDGKESEKERFLKTGDLGFFNNQELYITGRLKDLIIIDGKNIYPQDIERIVSASHDLMKGGSTVAFSISQEYPDNHFREEIVVITEIRAGVEQDLLLPISNTIKKQISLHENVSVKHLYFIFGHSLAKTTSGKIRRNVIKQQFLEKKLQLITPI